MNDFVSWLTSEIDARGWKDSEFARRADLSHATVSMVFSGQQRPGRKFAIGTARAFGLPPEDVLRRAGLLPPLPPSVTEEHEAVAILRTLSAGKREAAMQMLRGLAHGQREDLAQLPPTPEGLIPFLISSLPDQWKPQVVYLVRGLAELVERAETIDQE